VILGITLLTSHSHAQSVSATLRGTVRDSSGAVVSGAAVAVTNTEKGIRREVQTNGDGDYIVTQLPPQSYSISVSASQFQTQLYDRFILQVAQEARLDVTLTPGNVTTKVVVKDEAPLIQTEDSYNGAVLDAQKIEALPSNSRNFWKLAELDPNVSPSTTSSSLATRGGFVVAGQSDSANNYLLDGTDDNDWTTGQPTVRPSQDAVREFRIQTGVAPAEFGRRAGGQIQLTTRSGANEPHGSAFIFYRNSIFNARSYFTTSNPASQSKQTGGSFGGKLKKDRTFVFGAYEGTFVNADPSIALTVPSAQYVQGAKTGDFSFLLPSKQLRNPLTGVPYPNNQIPVTSQSLLLLQYFPAATVPGLNAVNNFVNNVDNVQNNHQLTFRIDHVLTPKQNISGGYSMLTGTDTGTSGDFVATTTTPGFETIGPHTYHHISFIHDYVVRPTLVNEFRAGFNRMDAGYLNQDQSLGNIVGKLGLPQGPNGFQSPDEGNTGVPLIRVNGYSTIGSGNNPQWRGDNTVHVADGLSWIRGGHTFKFGGDYVNFFKHSFFVSNGRGQFTTGPNADNVTSGDYFVDFLLGYFSTVSLGNGNVDQYPRQISFGAYAQDEWKVSRSLTLNYGLRYEFFGAHTEKNNLISYFDPVANTLHTGNGGVFALDNSTGLLRSAGSGATFNNLYDSGPPKFAPRFGFAYRVGSRSTTVVRGGYGIYYNLVAVQTWNGATALGAPFLLSKSFTTTKAAPLTWANPFAATVPVNSISITTIDPNIKRPSTEQWSLGLQHQFGGNFIVEASYQGSHTVHNNSSYAINNPLLSTRQANPAATVNALRPFNSIGNGSQWGSITVLNSVGTATYNSLVLRGERRFHNGLSFNSYIVYSKALELGDNQDPLNRSLDVGPSSFDQKFRFVTTSIYALPFGTGKRWLNGGSPLLRGVVSGWQLTGVFTAQSGRPFTVTTSDSLAANVGGSPRAFVVPGQDPNADIDTRTGKKTHTPDNWFNTGAFRANDTANASAATTTVFNYGTAGYNSLRGPGLQALDFGLSREIRVREEQIIEVRVEAFNALNHPNFGQPAANYGSLSTVGQISSTVGSVVSTATGASRQLQFGLRYRF
jgi:hypothetical protein